MEPSKSTKQNSAPARGEAGFPKDDPQTSDSLRRWVLRLRAGWESDKDLCSFLGPEISPEDAGESLGEFITLESDQIPADVSESPFVLEIFPSEVYRAPDVRGFATNELPDPIFFEQKDRGSLGSDPEKKGSACP